MGLRKYLILLLLSIVQHARCRTPLRFIVDLDYSRYQGESVTNGVVQYLGMRYAAPPVGHLRFRAPRDPPQTRMVQSASAHGPICIGAGQTITDAVDEDCLFINVFAPSNATRASNLPVWVYIQGGGYISNANANYNGSDVVRQSGSNTILVNFNYRVGVLGFLASEEVRRDGELNVGLLDQRKALEWVKKYIHKFGGNPDHVVIHGASAGAGSVAYHLAAYGGRDKQMFVGAIAQSPYWPSQQTVTQAEQTYNRLKAATNCSTLPCLRALDADVLQSAVSNPDVPVGSSDTMSWTVFSPVIDGALIPDRLYRLYEQGRFLRRPLIVGSDTDEGSIFAPNASSPAEVSQFLRSLYPSLSSRHLRVINRHYPARPPVPNHAAYFPSASAAIGDAALTCPGLEMTSSMARHFHGRGYKVWNYRYNVQDPTMLAAGLGVPHTVETEAIFGPDHGGFTTPSIRTTNAGIVPIVMSYYISFVRTLDPNTLRDVEAPPWHHWDGVGEQRLRIQTNMTMMEPVSGPERARCGMWKELARTMRV
ncbi:Alpha/Beta hydrolase protein [Aspergillus pseudoustus]|uniref:Carboxylic ester hydrolase n=1 Tax=Aspergillus pseudoustus TaxID=1810923 RepID=A0ABR4KID1_9EURO